MRSIAIVALAAGALALPAMGEETRPSKDGEERVKKESFGKTAEGEAVEIYTLTNASGLKARIMTYGAILTEMWVPDRGGKLADVVLGFDSLEGYLKGHPYFGATTGRYANRIAKGKFTLGGKTYTLAANNGPNHLHGGLKGLDKRVWKAAPVAAPVAGSPDAAVRFSYRSPDGEEGYPGNLDLEVTYTLTANNELRIDYQAKSDQATPINLTNHSYFNLAGAGSGTVLDHEIEIFADEYLPVDATSIPTGEMKAVKGSAMDFTRHRVIGKRITELAGEPGGYDHNYCLRSKDGSLALAARLYDRATGRVLEILTTQPGIQLYTGNYLDGTLRGKGGKVYPKNAAVCLETQHFPDSPNQSAFPSSILKPGETYRQTTVHRFLTR